MNAASVDGSTGANEPPTFARAKPNSRSASVSPGSHRAVTEAADAMDNPLFEGPLSSEESSLSQPPSPSPNKGKQSAQHGGPTIEPPKSSLKRRRSGPPIAKTSLSARSLSSVQFEVPDSDEPQTRVVEVDDVSSTDSSGYQSDPNDLIYGEPRQRLQKKTGAADPGPSPKHRSITKSSVGSVVKRLVKAADPHDAICLLTNAPKPTKACQYCQVVARRTKAEILTMLEWWWQMKYWTLYVDTRYIYNIFVLMANWHLAMDGNDWALVPHHKLITSVLEWTTKSYGDQTEFVYYVLALSEEMEEVAIHRYKEDFSPQTVIAHIHPFSTMGALTSHVHPHFVIFSAGQKLVKMTSGLSDEAADIFLDKLADAASFGHKADVKTANRNSLGEIIQTYGIWSSTNHVPQPGAGHEWRYHVLELKSQEEKSKELESREPEEEPETQEPEL
ncbi:hypothetical protein B0H19DRAFT_1083562 [Mycena capillaripes]|nr:hypothetical protein B0H19DRAFT_1083562 [Mycena capillaripes]